MNISREEVKHLANLSKLNFNDEEIEKLKIDLEEIVNFAESLSEIDTSDVEEKSHILNKSNVFRKDEVKNSFNRADMLKNAITKEAGCISVPKVVE